MPSVLIALAFFHGLTWSFSESSLTVSSSQTGIRTDIPRSKSRISGIANLAALRGGGADTDAELDAYVERLLAGVSDGENGVSNNIEEQSEQNHNAGATKSAETELDLQKDDVLVENDAVPTRRKRRRRKQKSASIPDVNEEIVEEEIKEDQKIEVENDIDEQGENRQINTVASDSEITKSKKTKRKKRRKKVASVEESEDGEHQIQEDVVEEDNFVDKGAQLSEEEEPILNQQPSTIVPGDIEQTIRKEAGKVEENVINRKPLGRPRQPLPPNSMQRFLLSQGFVGRALAALTLLISEFTHRYLPEVYRMITSALPKPSSGRYIDVARKKKSGESGVHSQYAAFASGQSVGGKKISKDKKKQLDQVALTKLKKLGGVKSGKYAYLSSGFMKKYNLGKYADEAKMFESIIAPLGKDSRSEDEIYSDSEESEEEEEDWVVQALTEKIEENIASKSIIEAAHRSTIAKKIRKDARVKSADKDGGGGVLGRLRAAGTSGVSSRIFGAYPGDAAPIEEAANRDGVIDIARRYGYGDWSDESDSNYMSDNDESFGQANKKKRKRKRRAPTRARSSSRSKFPDVSVSFEVGSSPSVSFGMGPSSPSTTRRRRKHISRGFDTRNRESQRSRRQLSRKKAGSDAEKNLGVSTRDARVRRPVEKRSSVLGAFNDDTDNTSRRTRRSAESTTSRRLSRTELHSRLTNSASASVQSPMKRTTSRRPSRDELHSRLTNSASASVRSPMKRTMHQGSSQKKERTKQSDNE